MKFEVIISVWDDGLFKLRERIESNDLDDLCLKFIDVTNLIEEKLAAEEERLKRIMEDDDIPF